MTQIVNLIPTPRRAAKRLRRLLRASAAACGAYALALACGVGVAHLVFAGGSDGLPLDRQLAAVDADVSRLERYAVEAAGELSRARATLEANRAIAEQPDWSVLLHLLAEATGEDVVLRSVSVAPPVGRSQATTGGTPAEVVLEVGGVGQTQLAVSRHVLRLEHTGLFEKVTLIETNREAFLNAPAIGFRLQCSFGQPAAPLAGSAAADVGGINR